MKNNFSFPVDTFSGSTIILVKKKNSLDVGKFFVDLTKKYVENWDGTKFFVFFSLNKLFFQFNKNFGQKNYLLGLAKCFFDLTKIFG